MDDGRCPTIEVGNTECAPHEEAKGTRADQTSSVSSQISIPGMSLSQSNPLPRSLEPQEPQMMTMEDRNWSCAEEESSLSLISPSRALSGQNLPLLDSTSVSIPTSDGDCREVNSGGDDRNLNLLNLMDSPGKEGREIDTNYSDPHASQSPNPTNAENCTLPVKNSGNSTDDAAISGTDGVCTQAGSQNEVIGTESADDIPPVSPPLPLPPTANVEKPATSSEGMFESVDHCVSEESSSILRAADCAHRVADETIPVHNVLDKTSCSLTLSDANILSEEVNHGDIPSDANCGDIPSDVNCGDVPSDASCGHRASEEVSCGHILSEGANSGHVLSEGPLWKLLPNTMGT